MDKTLHRKLTDKHQYTYPTYIEIVGGTGGEDHTAQERRIIAEISKDLLSPRPEAINRILELSRML